MPARPIITYPHPTLGSRAAEVTDFGPALRGLVADMAESMYAADGLGLAANQVDVLQRVFVIDMGEHEPDDPGLRVFVNPRILERDGRCSGKEGCLSFPGLYVDIKRAERVKVAAQDLDGTPFEVEAEDLFAVAIQHELDHLDGVVMFDRLGRLSRKLAEKRYRRLKAELDAEQAEQEGR